MTAYLYIEEEDRWNRVPIEDREFTIGRLPGNHLELTDEKVSRRHCRISRENGAYILEDLESSNGTEVNNREITSCEIVEGDVIRLGQVVLYFSEQEEPPEAADISDPGLDPERSQVKKVEDLPEPYGLEDSDLSLMDRSEGDAPADDVSEPPDREDTGDRNKFFLLYQLGKALNDELGLDGVLETAVESIVDVFTPRRCLIMLIPSDNETSDSDLLDPELGWKEGDGFVDGKDINISRTVTKRAVEQKAAIISMDAPSDPRFEKGRSIIDYNINSVMCVPLWDRDSVSGAVWVDAGREQPDYEEEDLNLLSAIANQLAIRIKQEQIFTDLKREAILRKNLERFHSPDVVEEISRTSMQGNEISQDLEESEISILFIDIERFSNMAERMPPRDVASLLSEFYDSISEIVFKHSGGISKYIGDKVMAVFGAPVSVEGHADQAVKAGKKMIQTIQKINQDHPDDIDLSVRVGINSGRVVHGYVGSRQVKDFTVIGDPVNVAARLEEIADPDEVLVGNRSRELMEEDIELESIGSVPLRGRKEQMDVYRAPHSFGDTDEPS